MDLEEDLVVWRRTPWYLEEDPAEDSVVVKAEDSVWISVDSLEDLEEDSVATEEDSVADLEGGLGLRRTRRRSGGGGGGEWGWKNVSILNDIVAKSERVSQLC